MDDSRDADRRCMEPLPKKPRLDLETNVKKEFNHTDPSQSNPLPVFDTDMRNFDCQPSTSRGYTSSQFQTSFPMNRLDDAYELYYSDKNQNNNYKNMFIGKKSY